MCYFFTTVNGLCLRQTLNKNYLYKKVELSGSWMLSVHSTLFHKRMNRVKMLNTITFNVGNISRNRISSGLLSSKFALGWFIVISFCQILCNIAGWLRQDDKCKLLLCWNITKNNLIESSSRMFVCFKKDFGLNRKFEGGSI